MKKLIPIILLAMILTACTKVVSYNISDSITLGVVNTHTVLLSDLAGPGYYHFVVTAFDKAGNESVYSNDFEINADKTSVTLTWDAPTENADSTELTDLFGYRIY